MFDIIVEALVLAIGKDAWARFCNLEDPDQQIGFLLRKGITPAQIARHFLFWQMAADEERRKLAA